jgi:hypothetical protein
MGIALFFIYFSTPILVVLNNGTNYLFAFSLSGVGLVLYVGSSLLIRHFIVKRAPGMLTDSLWEHTAGMGIVPRWVSEMGLVGTAFVFSGLVIALLILLGFV